MTTGAEEKEPETCMDKHVLRIPKLLNTASASCTHGHGWHEKSKEVSFLVD